ncbi:hypothetical protein SKM57_05270 [Acinetobacter faecalis]|uniref:hypothetical protein n=1 Tax=Acinetobacter faecalis TaxID=2665161 RepID=UPI002A9109A4|nr:hypothetical protein [Acinetobacter faecalis]MDY6467998.1 hypothetical protein [Acinetobacter faecalis]
MKKFKFNSILFLILGITSLLYWNGLYGDYVFDDSANILENNKLAMTELTYEALKAAYGSGDAGPLGRPISMLSFALNHYFSGFDPFYFKLTNLFIHLLNGVLICFLSLSILNWINKDKKLSDQAIAITALAVTVVWLLHPLNLTSVLYIVQRMTSLSTLFGLLALVLYCQWRSRVHSKIGSVLLLCGVVIAFVCAALSKESGLLFIPLLYLIELAIFQAKSQLGHPYRIYQLSLIKILWVTGFIGLVILFYLVQPHLHSSAFVRRDFNLEERLLTEARVIFFYIKMFIYPQLNELSLYHDDFIISKSFLNPISTLYSIVAIGIITLSSLLLVKKYPLVLFAWGWFVISHLMESTVFSLELVHEHRNYFAFFGFILVIGYYLAQIKNEKLKPFIYLFVFIFILNLAFTTWQRATIWSNLVDHAVYEATMSPQSDRANYQAARVYMKLMQNERNEQKKNEYIEQAYYYLNLSKQSYLPANGAWFAEIHLDSYLDKQVSNATINELIDRLKNRPLQNSNVSFLSAFTNCQIESLCKLSPVEVIQVLTAALENPTSNSSLNSEIYKLLAQYYIASFNDFIKGEEFLQTANKLNTSVNGHLLLSQAYRLQGKLELAKNQIHIAESLDQNGVWFKEISIEKRNIKQALTLGK